MFARHLFILIRSLYIPYDLHEMYDIRDKIAELFTSTIPQFFRLGIKQAPGMAATEGWYYGSGEFFC